MAPGVWDCWAWRRGLTSYSGQGGGAWAGRMLAGGYGEGPCPTVGLALSHLYFLNAKLSMSFLNLGTVDIGMERFFAGGGGRRMHCGWFSSTLGLSPPRMPGAASFPSSDEQKGPQVVPGVLGQRPSPLVGKPCLEIPRARWSVAGTLDRVVAVKLFFFLNQLCSRSLVLVFSLARSP